jgi:glutaredoxin-related protein
MRTEQDVIIQLLMHQMGIVRFSWTAELDRDILRQDVKTHYNWATMEHVVELVPKARAEEGGEDE